MAFGSKTRAPKLQIQVEFDHAGRTYRVELPGTEYKEAEPHPLNVSDFYSGVWKLNDLTSGAVIYGNLSNFGPIRLVPQQIQ